MLICYYVFNFYSVFNLLCLFAAAKVRQFTGFTNT